MDVLIKIRREIKLCGHIKTNHLALQILTSFTVILDCQDLINNDVNSVVNQRHFCHCALTYILVYLRQRIMLVNSSCVHTRRTF